MSVCPTVSVLGFYGCCHPCFPLFSCLKIILLEILNFIIYLPFSVFSLNGELLVDPSAGDAAFGDVNGETFVPACTLGKYY